MQRRCATHFGDIARWTDPEGGFFLWVTLDNGVDATELFEPALAEGVAFIPGIAFSPSRPIHRRPADVLRLDAARADPRRASRGCGRAVDRTRRPRLTGVSVSAAERRVLDQIDESARSSSSTRSLVRAPAQNPPGEEAATVAALGAAAAELGSGRVRDDGAAGAANLRSTLAGGHGPGLLLLGHTDVVPVGEGWTVDPFGGAVENGRLYGRGSTDMKGGLAACVAAMAALRGAVVLSGPVELAALVDEEETGAGIRRVSSSR